MKRAQEPTDAAKVVAAGGLAVSTAEVPPSRLGWVDLVRAGGAFLVVLAHVILYPSLAGAGPLWAQSLYYTATRVAVPLFFMVSGYLLLGKQESLGDFFRKRTVRVFVPFLVWSYVYLAWSGAFSGNNVGAMSIVSGFIRILRGPRAAHLWFFYALIGLYFITPTLRIFAVHARNRDLLYFCALWFLIVPGFSLLEHMTSLRMGFEFQFLSGYIGYFVLGFYLGRIKLTRWHIYAAAALLLVSSVLTFLTVYFGQQAQNYDQFFEGYLSVAVVPMTLATYLLARASNTLLSAKILTPAILLSKASLGIYLLHVIVLDILNAYLAPLLPFLRSSSSMWTMPIAALIGFVSCLLAVVVIQKVPILKYAVP